MKILPETKTPPKAALADYTILLYGRSKIGKSTWCSHATDAVFLATEPGLNALEVYQAPISSWEEFLEACADLGRGGHPFKTVIVDTVDNAYKMCEEYILKREGVNHESDLGFGKGWSLVNGEFHRVLTKLASLPYGLILVSHAQEIEIDTRLGKAVRIVPTLPTSARKAVLALVDLIFYADIETTTDEAGKPSYRRVIRTKPTSLYDAGDRTGRLPETVPLDWAFVAEFNKRGQSPQGGTK